MLADEVQPVLISMLASGINIVAISANDAIRTPLLLHALLGLGKAMPEKLALEVQAGVKQ